MRPTRADPNGFLMRPTRPEQSATFLMRPTRAGTGNSDSAFLMRPTRSRSKIWEDR